MSRAARREARGELGRRRLSNAHRLADPHADDEHLAVVGAAEGGNRRRGGGRRCHRGRAGRRLRGGGARPLASRDDELAQVGVEHKLGAQTLHKRLAVPTLVRLQNLRQRRRRAPAQHAHKRGAVGT